MTASDFLILNYDQELAKSLASKTKAQVVPFSSKEKVEAYFKYLGDLVRKKKPETKISVQKYIL